MKTKQRRPIIIVACRIFETLINDRLPKNLVDQIIYLDYGLHVTPKNLKKEVQITIDQIEEPSLIVFGYGLCGNGIAGINSKKHILLIPRTDDCIAVLLGSYDEYLNVFHSEPGTYYLTKGWLEAGSNPLQEYRGYISKYGSDKADMIMDLQYQNYTRLMFVAQNQKEIEQYDDQAKEIATFCQRWEMRYEERLGSDRYIRLLIEMMKKFQESGELLPNDNQIEDFVIIPPETEIEGRFFLRS